MVQEALAESAPPLSLAQQYTESINHSRYWISEKFDGARAWWDGSRFLTRSGAVYQAPEWFTRDLPEQILDGELWIGRGQFQQLMQTIRDTIPDDVAWRSVRFLVFDAPAATGNFEQRQAVLATVLASVSSEWVQQVVQKRYSNHEQLTQWMHKIVDAGGEGLILQHGSAMYRAGRHPGMLKLKPYQDAEATVTGYGAGKGKYRGMTGSLLVVDNQGNRFKLGSGLSDAERRSPPPLGSIVTYRYQGRTLSGKPRFARYLRRRAPE
ncbi:DNA ligase [Chromatiales bacterium (ex Bugula neritina AB1)]|nr:DNA ligase [Chromatiales bacterium (ex Bugula neritina AB1)]